MNEIAEYAHSIDSNWRTVIQVSCLGKTERFDDRVVYDGSINYKGRKVLVVMHETRNSENMGSYLFIPGYQITTAKRKVGINSSLVEPITDESARKKITEKISENKMFRGQVVFG
ncbi:MAG: hypothetical protein PHU12_02450 [Candidatus Aenigmarchaeota archaeon]|nr:hypothetical protein [Candidatus Aenigmarchaeota archaeon]